MLFDKLTEDNFVLYAAKFYENPSCESVDEFQNDLIRIKYIKRLFKKYRNGEELRERLIMNHLIVLYNVFHHVACTRMLCYRLESYLAYLKPFLIYLNYWPQSINIGDEELFDSEIPLDPFIVQQLRSME